MTWGEIELLAIQKMFINTVAISVEQLDDLKKDKKYEIYINAMPTTANEAFRIILTRGKPYIKTIKLEDEKCDEDLTNDKHYVFDLKKIIEDYHEITNIYVDMNEYHNYVIRQNRYLVLPVDVVENETVLLSYEAKPVKITSDTEYDFEIDLPQDVCNLVALYIAAELYKDDDISTATLYMNEFEAELAAMHYERNDSEFTSVNNWL